MTTLSIALEPEQIDELLCLLSEGSQTDGICSQLRAHKSGHLHKLSSDHAKKIHDALGDVFDELQQKSDAIKHTLPLISERILKDLEPAQNKAKELAIQFDALRDLPRGKKKEEAQLNLHRVISDEMSNELNKVASLWGQDPVSLNWCDHEIKVLAKIIPLTGGILAPLGQDFARLVNPERLWKLRNSRFDQLELRIRINEQRSALRSLFNFSVNSNVASLVR